MDSHIDQDLSDEVLNDKPGSATKADELDHCEVAPSRAAIRPNPPEIYVTEQNGEPELEQNGDIDNEENTTSKEEQTAEVETDDITKDESETEFDVGDTSKLDGAGRNDLYEKGLKFALAGKKTLALKCYLGCLNGIKQNSGFVYLPQCLHNVAEIYYSKEEYDKAVHFIQGEKLFYESALLEASTLQKKLEDKQKVPKQDKEENDDNDEGDDDDDTGQDQHADHPDVLRAEEYQSLARMCLDKNQPQLALEYCGKATKLRQQVYGNQHPVTLKSLDYFTAVYAEAGKEQYTESMRNLLENPEVLLDNANTDSENIGKNVRNRKKMASEKGSKKENAKVRFQEPPHTTVNVQKEETISRVLLMVFSLLIICFLVIFGIYLGCRAHPHSQTCKDIKSNFQYYFMRVKFLYYSYTAAEGNQYG